MDALPLLGFALVLIGLALMAAPLLVRYFDVGHLPSWILYMYRSNGFYFITSPLLLILSLLSFVLYLLTK